MVSLGIVYGEIGSSVSHPVNRIAYVRAMARGPPPDTASKRDGGGWWGRWDRRRLGDSFQILMSRQPHRVTTGVVQIHASRSLSPPFLHE